MSRPEGGASIADSIAMLAMAALGSVLTLRWVRYLPIELPVVLDQIVGLAMIGAVFFFLVPLLFAVFQVAAIGTVAALALWRPAWVVTRVDRQWRLLPWVHAALWVECLLNHYLFDLNPPVALLVLLGLVVFEIDRAARLDARGSRLLLGAAVVALLALAVRMETRPDALAGLLFASGFAGCLRPAKRWLGPNERRLALILLGVACQAFASLLPLALPSHGGTRIGNGMAYSFCEAPARSALYAAVPQALTMTQWSVNDPHGGPGFVAEYDAESLAKRAEHRFFSERFFGRLEFLVCLDDSVLIGMTNVTLDGRKDQDHAMAFSMSDPRQYQPDLLGGGVGHGIAFDPRRDALFYVSEIKPTVTRVDRRTGERITTEIGFRSLVVGPRSVHAGRDTLYLAEWLFGRLIHELDLETLEVGRTFRHGNGGATGVTVDEDLDRVYSVGMWGLEVFNLATGELVARKRLGLLNRSPAIDSENDLLLVPSTVEGKIRVFDRHSLALLGVIAIGHGPRIPYYSREHRRFYSGNSRAQFVWEGQALRERFR